MLKKQNIDKRYQKLKKEKIKITIIKYMFILFFIIHIIVFLYSHFNG